MKTHRSLYPSAIFPLWLDHWVLIDQMCDHIILHFFNQLSHVSARSHTTEAQKTHQRQEYISFKSNALLEMFNSPKEFKTNQHLTLRDPKPHLQYVFCVDWANFKLQWTLYLNLVCPFVCVYVGFKYIYGKCDKNLHCSVELVCLCKENLVGSSI